MPDPRFDIIGIGNAIVDVVAPAEDRFLSKHSMRKGSMNLVDAAAAENLYRQMPSGQESSGGSVANSCAVASGLGAKVAYLGKVADDTLGAAFRRDIEKAGVYFPSTPLVGGAPTARCLILVTPDAERTMTVYLGACVAFGVADVDAALIADSAVTYLEGYLFDPPSAQAAFRLAASVARKAGRKVALSLSDPFCVDRHRPAFREFVAGSVDILFANESEICSLYEENDFAQAAERAAQDTELSVLTRSGDGSVVRLKDKTIVIAAEPTQVVDTTGAGDAYAAGFLAALTAGRPLDVCGRLGSLAAAEVISHFGARPIADLRAMAANSGIAPL
jgi:fructokinase